MWKASGVIGEGSDSFPIVEEIEAKKRGIRSAVYSKLLKLTNRLIERFRFLVELLVGVLKNFSIMAEKQFLFYKHISISCITRAHARTLCMLLCIMPVLISAYECWPKKSKNWLKLTLLIS